MQKVKEDLQEEFRQQYERTIRDKLREQVRAVITEQVKVQVDAQLKEHIPVSLRQQLEDTKQQLKEMKISLQNSEARTTNSELTETDLFRVLAVVLTPEGKESDKYPQDLCSLFAYDLATARTLVREYGLVDSEVLEVNFRRFLAHIEQVHKAYSRLTHSELTLFLKVRNLPTAGTHQELVSRLCNHDLHHYHIPNAASNTKTPPSSGLSLIPCPGSQQSRSKLRTDLPVEILADIMDHLGDWELSRAVGVPTSLSQPLEWTRASRTDWAVLTGDMRKIREANPSLSNPLTSLGAVVAIRFGDENILEYFLSQHLRMFQRVFKDDLIPIKASLYGRVRVLSWWKHVFEQHPDLITPPSSKSIEEAVDQASRSGQIASLDWWLNDYGHSFEYTEAALEYASAKNRIAVLEWWKHQNKFRGVPLKIGRVMDMASTAGHVEVLEWWATSQLEFNYDRHALQHASCHGKVEVLQWWLGSGLQLLFDQEALTGATRHNRPEVLEWWDRSGLPIQYRMCDIEEALEDALGVPQVLEYGPAAVKEQRSLDAGIWEKTLSNVYEDLSSSTPRPIRLAVYGIDEASASEDFVTALLSNPFDASGEQSQLLRSRWKDAAGDSVTVSYGAKAVQDRSNIQLSCPYLQQFPVPVEVVELRAGRSKHNKALEDAVLAKLLEADIPILLCNPLVTSIEHLLSTPLPSNTILVLVSTPSQQIDLQQLLSGIPQHYPKPTILIADPKRASDAISLLQSNPTSSLVIQTFQDAFNGSNISAVTRALETTLSQPKASSQPSSASAVSPSDYLRVKLALNRLHDALSYCRASLAEIKSALNSASIDASRLNTYFEETRTKFEHSFLSLAQSSPSSHSTKPQVDKVEHAIADAEKNMKQVMERFTWWRMLWRVDETTTLIAGALQQHWCVELERELLIQTGKLHAIQAEFEKESFKLLSDHPALQSNVLRNSLLQLQASPKHQLTNSTLTAPVAIRRNQIIEYPTARLHLTAQRTVLGMTGGIVGGAGVGWVGWMGWLVGNSESLLGSLFGMEPVTAMGVGALTAVASVRWAVGRWEKGKKKWWQDWRRVGEGLERDLRTTMADCMQRQVGEIPLAASKGLAQTAAQQEDIVGKLEDEAQRVNTEVKEAIHGISVNTK
ncbi:hypothetical protein H1R20_g8487, partial [Candolleomyces eurysporus]